MAKLSQLRQAIGVDRTPGASNVITIPYQPRNWARGLHSNLRRFGALLLHRRAGKAQPLTAKVLTPSGFVAMGSLSLGSLIVGPDGLDYPVAAITPQGSQPIYQINLTCGATTTATLDHLWRARVGRNPRPRVITTSDIIDALRGGLQVSIERAAETKVGSILTSWRAIGSISSLPAAECQCITVDSLAGLYITDDWIVTHNSTAVVNHHQRAAIDDAWETRRLLYLRPTLTKGELEELIRPPGGRHYGHVMPQRNQAKTVVWDKLKYYASGIPGVKFNEQELLIRYPNNNKLQLFGADDPDKLRGLAFSGLSFDEYSQQPSNIFSEVLSKALADHLGYALFVGTVKGEDHLWDTYQAAKDDPEWFSLWQDIDKSLATEEGVTIKVLEQAMTDDRKLVEKGLMTQDEFDQEWFLSVDAAIKGAYFGKEMAAMLKSGRIAHVPFDPMLPVDTDWDLGMDDYTAILFSQSLRTGEIRIIDYEEGSGEGLPYYVQVLANRARDLKYVYGKHYPPHDIAVREMGTGKSRKETAASLGLKFEEPVTLPFADGIQATRLILSRCWIDKERCHNLISALRQYRKQWDAQNEIFKDKPVHNWASHGADGTRGLAVRYQTPRLKVERKKRPRAPWSWGS